MPTPISELVLEAIEAQLATIQVANGYLTDIGLNVSRADRTPDPDSIVVWDGGESTDEGHGGMRGMAMEQVVLVDVHFRAGKADTGLLIGKGKADVKQCLLRWSRNGGFRAVPGLGNGASLSYESCETSARADGAQTEWASLRFIAKYKEGHGDPYAESYTPHR
jgi:hypothetical protein